MNIIAENPFWLIFMIVLTAGACVVMAFGLRDNKHGKIVGLFGVVLLLLAILIFFVSRAIVTEQEAVIGLVKKLANRVAANDLEGTVGFMHPDNEIVILKVKNEMPQYDFQTCSVLGFGDLEIDTESEPAKAKVEFSVFVNVDATRSIHNAKGVARRGVILYLEKYNGEWKVTDYKHFEPAHKKFMQARGEEF